MITLGLRYLWFKLAIALGSLLGLLLLILSVRTYYETANSLIAGELGREAMRQVRTLTREVRLENLSGLALALDEMRKESPGKIAWIRVYDAKTHLLGQTGSPVGPLVVPRPGPRRPDLRQTPAGRVSVAVFPWFFRPDGPPGPLVEVALYWDSASAVFGPLLTNLFVDCTAALGLVASMILLWFRLPNYVRGKQLEQQTELARQVQMDLLPPADVTFPGLDFSAECVPAWQVGGDFYDVFSTDDGHLAIVLGDVSGKGLPASVVVGLLLGAVRASSWMGGSLEHEASSRRLSELLRTRTSLERFASLFWCYYDPQTQILQYVNAGHLPPMVFSGNGGGPIQVQRLEEGGPVLGVVPGAEYRQGTAWVASGDLLVMYSDGVVEAMNAAEEQFGEERLCALIQRLLGRPSAEIRDAILGEVHAFLGAEKAQDDLTLVVARFTSG